MKFSRFNVGAISFLFTFTFGALSILLPLYLLEKQFRLEEIGLLLAIAPVIFMIVRIIFGALGDIIGNRVIFLIHGISGFISLLAYFFAATPLYFAVGKIMEGVKSSGFWAVNRTEIYRYVKVGNEGKEASFMLGVRNAGVFAGRLFVGAFLLYLGFQNTLIALLILSAFAIFYSFKIKKEEKKKHSSGKELLSNMKTLILAKRSPVFWKGALILALAAIADAAAYSYLIPIYFNLKLEMNALDIGIAFAFYSLMYAIAVFYTLKKNISFRSLAILGFLLASLPFIAFPLVSRTHAFLIIGLLGLGDGFGGPLFENIIIKSTGHRKHIATEYGIIHIPYRLAEIVSLVSVGFFISLFGFSALFIIVAVTQAIFFMIAPGFLSRGGHKYAKSHI